MNATLRNEMRPVTRQRFDVIWCPFCDRSRQETRPTPFCEGCGAEFTDGPPITLIAAPVVEEAVAEDTDADAGEEDGLDDIPAFVRRNRRSRSDE